MKKWSRNISPLLKKELERLESGNQTQRKRCDQTLLTINRVLQNPTSPIYKKSELDGHCAADVGQQYRLFFFIEHELGVVNFVWMNNEESIHTTSAVADYCYEQFKKLLREGEIEKYTPPLNIDERFQVRGNLRSDDYVSFHLKNKIGSAFSSAHIHLVEDPEIVSAAQSGARIYAIDSLATRPESEELKLILVGCMCSEADESQVCYSYRAARHEHNLPEMEELLFKFGFEILGESEGSENIYIRHPR